MRFYSAKLGTRILADHTDRFFALLVPSWGYPSTASVCPRSAVEPTLHCKSQIFHFEEWVS